MDRITWSNTEKKIARHAFGTALAREEASLLADFKARAAAAATQDDMWAVYRFLAERDGVMGRKYEFRYSELISLFVLLRAEGWLDEADLAGLRDDKLAMIREGCARWQRHFERGD
jgi:hypothetical protein